MSSEDNPVSQFKRIHCNQCGSQTNHSLCGEHLRHVDVEEDGEWLYSEDDMYRLWICAGCETATLEVESRCSIFAEISYSYSPQRSITQLDVKQFLQLPDNLAVMYRECILSFNAGLRLLCAAGLRALIEGICNSKEIGGKYLVKKIDGLEAFLPRNIVESLHSFRFMGNDAVHQLEPPALDDLRIAIEVCEDLMNYLYDLDYKARNLPRREGNPQCKPQSSN